MINLQRTYQSYNKEILYDSKHQKDMTKSVESKDQPVILAAIKLYQKVLVIVEIVGSYSKCLKHMMMMMMYCTIIKLQ